MLDIKDKKILYQLDLNLRQPINQITKKVGLSKDMVNYRLRKLEQSMPASAADNSIKITERQRSNF